MKVMYRNKLISNTLQTYIGLPSKPKINSILLIGNMTSGLLNMYNKKLVDTLINSMRNIKVVTALPTELAMNTIYFVGDGTAAYNVYATDSLKKLMNLGTTDVDFSLYQKKSDTTLQTASKNVVGAINLIDDRVGDTVLITTAQTVTAAVNEVADKCETFVGATLTSDGVEGLVKAPVAGDQTKFLKGNGTWAVPDVEGVNYAEKDSGKLFTSGGMFNSISCNINNSSSASVSFTSTVINPLSIHTTTEEILKQNGFVQDTTNPYYKGKAVYKRTFHDYAVGTISSGNSKVLCGVDQNYNATTTPNITELIAKKPFASNTIVLLGNDFSVTVDGSNSLEMLYAFSFSNDGGANHYIYTSANCFTSFSITTKNVKNNVWAETEQTNWTEVQPAICIKNTDTTTANNIVLNGTIYVILPLMFEINAIAAEPVKKSVSKTIYADITNGSLYVHD